MADIPRLKNLHADLNQANDLLADFATKLGSVTKLMEKFGVEKNVIKSLEKRIQKEKEIKKLQEQTTKELQKKNIQLDELKKKRDSELAHLQKTKKLEQDAQKYGGKHHAKMAKRLAESEQSAASLDSQYKILGLEVADLDKTSAGLTSQLGSLNSIGVTLAATIGINIVGAIAKFAAAIVTLGIDTFFKSLELIQTGIKKIYDLVNRTVKAIGTFNLTLGASTKNLKGLQKEGWEAEGALRGLSDAELGVGLEEMAGVIKSFGFVEPELRKFRTTAVLAGRAMGIGSEAAGELSRAFYLMGTPQSQVATAFTDISDAAELAGVSESEFGKELLQVKPFMVSFGVAAKKMFLDSMAYAKRLGISMQSMEKFTEVTDSFEKSAEMAAKMNTVFGTSINAMDMMLEKDPAKRIEKIRVSMLKQGKSIDQMSRQEINFMEQVTGLQKEELSGMLKNGLTYDQIMKKKEKKQKSEEEAQRQIQKATLKTAQTLNNWGATFDKITKAFMPILKPFTDWLRITGKAEGKIKTFSDRVNQFVGIIQKFFDKLGKSANVQLLLDKIFGTSSKLMNDIFAEDGEAAGKAIDTIVGLIDVLAENTTHLWEMAEELFSGSDSFFAPENLRAVVDGFRDIVTFGRALVSAFVEIFKMAVKTSAVLERYFPPAMLGKFIRGKLFGEGAGEMVQNMDKMINATDEEKARARTVAKKKSEEREKRKQEIKEKNFAEGLKQTTTIKHETVVNAILNIDSRKVTEFQARTASTNEVMTSKG